VGRKQDRAWKQVYLCVAILISLALAGCTFMPPPVTNSPGAKKDDHTTSLAAGRKLFGQGDFAAALRELEKASSSPCANPDVSQEILLLSGLIWMDPANPKRDYGKSATFFRKLVENNSNSPFAAQARILVALMKENDESTRTIERLKGLIEAAKKVDIGIDEKKREKAR
jgi:hypothetical protein